MTTQNAHVATKAQQRHQPHTFMYSRRKKKGVRGYSGWFGKLCWLDVNDRQTKITERGGGQGKRRHAQQEQKKKEKEKEKRERQCASTLDSEGVIQSRKHKVHGRGRAISALWVTDVRKSGEERQPKSNSTLCREWLAYHTHTHTHATPLPK